MELFTAAPADVPAGELAPCSNLSYSGHYYVVDRMPIRRNPNCRSEPILRESGTDLRLAPSAEALPGGLRRRNPSRARGRGIHISGFSAARVEQTGICAAISHISRFSCPNWTSKPGYAKVAPRISRFPITAMSRNRRRARFTRLSARAPRRSGRETHWARGVSRPNASQCRAVDSACA